MNAIRIIVVAIIVVATTSCASNPYWIAYRHDGVQKHAYLKQGWPADHKCSAYTSNNPIKRSTWAKQFYYRKAKRKI